MPFIFFHVEPGYAIGWMGRSTSNRGLKGTLWIPNSDVPKYIGIVTEGEPKGPAGADGVHDRLEVARDNGSETLSPATHICAGGLVRVQIPRLYKHCGHLNAENYYRLDCLKEFLTARPGSLNASPDSIPEGIGLDIDSLRTVRTTKDSVREGWSEQLATLAARHKSKSAVDKTQPAAEDSSDPAPPPSPAKTRAPQEAARPPAPTQARRQAGNLPTEPRQHPTVANATRDGATQPPIALEATSQGVPSSLAQADNRQESSFKRNAQGLWANVTGVARDINLHNAPVYNEHRNMLDEQSARDCSSEEEGEIRA
jgi:hypothetical protein